MSAITHLTGRFQANFYTRLRRIEIAKDASLRSFNYEDTWGSILGQIITVKEGFKTAVNLNVTAGMNTIFYGIDSPAYDLFESFEENQRVNMKIMIVDSGNQTGKRRSDAQQSRAAKFSNIDGEPTAVHACMQTVRIINTGEEVDDEDANGKWFTKDFENLALKKHKPRWRECISVADDDWKTLPECSYCCFQLILNNFYAKFADKFPHFSNSYGWTYNRNDLYQQVCPEFSCICGIRFHRECFQFCFHRGDVNLPFKCSMDESVLTSTHCCIPRAILKEGLQKPLSEFQVGTITVSGDMFNMDKPIFYLEEQAGLNGGLLVKFNIDSCEMQGLNCATELPDLHTSRQFLAMRIRDENNDSYRMKAGIIDETNRAKNVDEILQTSVEWKDLDGKKMLTYERPPHITQKELENVINGQMKLGDYLKYIRDKFDKSAFVYCDEVLYKSIDSRPKMGNFDPEVFWDPLRQECDKIRGVNTNAQIPSGRGTILEAHSEGMGLRTWSLMLGNDEKARWLHTKVKSAASLLPSQFQSVYLAEKTFEKDDYEPMMGAKVWTIIKDGHDYEVYRHAVAHRIRRYGIEMGLEETLGKKLEQMTCDCRLEYYHKAVSIAEENLLKFNIKFHKAVQTENTGVYVGSKCFHEVLNLSSNQVLVSNVGYEELETVAPTVTCKHVTSTANGRNVKVDQSLINKVDFQRYNAMWNKSFEKTVTIDHAEKEAFRTNIFSQSRYRQLAKLTDKRSVSSLADRIPQSSKMDQLLSLSEYELMPLSLDIGGSLSGNTSSRKASRLTSTGTVHYVKILFRKRPMQKAFADMFRELQAIGEIRFESMETFVKKIHKIVEIDQIYSLSHVGVNSIVATIYGDETTSTLLDNEAAKNEFKFQELLSLDNVTAFSTKAYLVSDMNLCTTYY